MFCKPVERTRRTDDGYEFEDRYWVLREFVVFHAAQVEAAMVRHMASWEERRNKAGVIAD